MHRSVDAMMNEIGCGKSSDKCTGDGLHVMLVQGELAQEKVHWLIGWQAEHMRSGLLDI